jgi:hypothetical protein
MPDNDKWLVSFYDDRNKFRYKIVTEMDIIEEDEYQVIQKRINGINEILKDL